MNFTCFYHISIFHKYQGYFCLRYHKFLPSVLYKLYGINKF
ncbi:hypothetical protein CLOSTASPAR_03949 [[Clostridium] asparagiforme DSM 15981]|uniref:Uncharacterized protein n=1 Tax=[Clostridium] asparagiforme DSM 15981 TaxID=518636 RepID=C0D3V8_9FIRM|nr:hypothetical protein CLOSTASPAR_03949 [[Clostridium] asparagiforme DSM 15981]